MGHVERNSTKKAYQTTGGGAVAAFSVMYGNVETQINRSDQTALVKSAINRAISYYAHQKRFWFNEATTTFSTVASQETYGTGDGVPTTMLAIDQLQVQINSSYKQELTPRTYDWIAEANATTTTGVPSDYAYYASNIYMSMIPDAVYTMDLAYLKSYADLSADGDTNDFTDNAQELIEARACWWMYSVIFRNKDAANDAKERENIELRSLINQTIRLKGKSRTRPFGY